MAKEVVGETPRGKTCDAIMGILDEGKEIMDDDAVKLDATLREGKNADALLTKRAETEVSAYAQPAEAA